MDGPIPDADRRATIRDVARVAGVSKSTVSLVLTGSPLVRARTSERVREAAATLGYVYDRGAARLRGRGHTIIGMVINDLANPFYTELAIGIERACQAENVVPFLANTAENTVRQAQVIRSMREHGAAGLILAPALDSEAVQVDALTGGVPVVFAMRRLRGARGSAVVPDNRGGARLATAHLVSLGHRRIAFLGGEPGMIVRGERQAGYRDALLTAGLDADPALLVDSLPTREGGRAALAQVLALARPATAALAYNDVVAIGAMQALAERGLAAGRDFALVGFDDIAEARQMVPPLTSVAVDGEGLGERAARLLLRRIAQPTGNDEIVVGAVQLVVRRSCGVAGGAE